MSKKEGKGLKSFNKGFQVPDTYIIIFLVVVVAALLTFLVPKGFYETQDISYMINGVEKTRTVIKDGSFQYLTDDTGNVVTRTAITESYPTATNNGQRIIVNGSASSPIPKTAPPRENSTKSIGISSFSAPFALRINPINPDSIAPVRIMIPNAPPTTIRNAIISIAELLTIQLLQFLLLMLQHRLVSVHHG